MIELWGWNDMQKHLVKLHEGVAQLAELLHGVLDVRDLLEQEDSCPVAGMEA